VFSPGAGTTVPDTTFPMIETLRLASGTARGADNYLDWLTHFSFRQDVQIPPFKKTTYSLSACFFRWFGFSSLENGLGGL
jgi:hypothetical protein